MRMKRYCFIFLSFTSLANSVFTVTRKDEGDSFARWFSDGTCDELSRHTAYGNGDSSGCQCYYSLTFSAENRMCLSYHERGNNELSYCSGTIS